MKILSIGNSFSQDAHRWLYSIAKADNYVLDTVNLYIGGCSLETHWNNILENNLVYDMEGNNGQFLRKTSIEEIIENDEFDVITLQQVSGLSGRPQSYFPYIINIAEYVRKKQPNAKIYFHMTWSYEIDSTHPSFVHYNSDQKEMYRRIYDASNMAAKIINAEIIPSGNIIQYLRENSKEFNYKNGGISLCRDGFHLSSDYGRLAVAYLWYKALTGRNIKQEHIYNINKEWDINLINTIIKAVENFY